MKNKNWIVYPQLTGKYEDTTITILNATFNKVEDKGKGEYYRDEGFGSWLLLEGLFCDLKIIAIRKGSLFQKKRYYCPVCDSELDPNSSHLIQSEYQVKYQEFQPVTVKIILPSVECPNCHKISSIDPDGLVSNSITEAMLDAYKNGNIKTY